MAQSIYIETPPKQYKKNKRRIKIIDGRVKDQEVNKQELKSTIKLHRKNIKQLRSDIKKHKLLIKQAKLAYRISK